MRGIIHLLLLLSATYFTSAEIKNKGWWKNTVFYQIYPRSFMDSNDDGIGDLNGVTSKLEHFKDAGIGAIWLSPIYTSPMVDFGYDIADFKDIDSKFGTMSDFTKLTARAKQLGIKVILDLVPNHTSDQHQWFKYSVAGIGKYKDYYMWHPGKNNGNSPPNNWLSVFSKSGWTKNAQRKMWYFHQFEYRQPDLNYSNPEVQYEMKEVIKFWLRKGVDGFRVDAVPHLYEIADLRDEPKSNTPGATPDDYTYLNHIYTKDDPRTYELVQSWRKVLDEYADINNEDEKVMMTEAYTSLENTTRFYNYGAQIPFNFKFITDVSSKSNAEDFKNVIDSWLANTPQSAVANWVMGNHDRPRTATRYSDRGDQMTMLAMILPGVAVTYNGEEIGMLDKTDISWEDTQDPQACNAGKDKYQSRSRDPCRTPFQWDDSKNAGFSKSDQTWLPVHANYKSLNLAKQKTAAESPYKIYKALTSLRQTSAALKNGVLKTVTANNNSVLIVSRQSGTESITLIINFSDKDQQTLNIKSRVPMYNKTVVQIASMGSSLKAGTTVDPTKVALPAKASIVLKSTN